MMPLMPMLAVPIRLVRLMPLDKLEITQLKIWTSLVLDSRHIGEEQIGWHLTMFTRPPPNYGKQQKKEVLESKTKKETVGTLNLSSGSLRMKHHWKKEPIRHLSKYRIGHSHQTIRLLGNTIKPRIYIRDFTEAFLKWIQPQNRMSN